MNCPICNKEVSPEWNVCPHCGYKPVKCSNPKCNSGWLPPEAKFCPVCGSKVVYVGGIEKDPISTDEPNEIVDVEDNNCVVDQISIVEQFPEMELQPTTAINPFAVHRKIYRSCIFVSTIFLFLLFLANRKTSINDLSVPSVFIIGYILLCIIFSQLAIKPEKSLIQMTDYLQKRFIRTKTGKGIRVFVKNRKFGVLQMKNFSFSIIVPAIYDSMTWDKSNQLFKVSKDNRVFFINIYNNEVKL